MSRYVNLYRVKDEGYREMIETQDKIIIPRTLGDRIYEVEKEVENRLDLVSYKFYKTSRLWWVIAYASHIDNPFNIPVGTNLRIPPFQIAMFMGGME
nr:MAG TPA: baseplate wedge protein [Caudoviricetes sp.]